MKRLKNIALALMMGAGISASAAFVYNASTALEAEISGAPAVLQTQSSATGTTLLSGSSINALNNKEGSILQNSQAPSGGCANCTGCNSQCVNYKAY